MENVAMFACRSIERHLKAFIRYLRPSLVAGAMAWIRCRRPRLVAGTLAWIRYRRPSLVAGTLTPPFAELVLSR